MIPLILQTTTTKINKPICPTFIHDEPTRIIISLLSILVLSGIYWKIWRYFNVI